MIFFNRYFDKNRLKTLVLWNLTRSGEKKTIDLVEKLKDIGFHYATQAGLSLSIDDLKIPPNKAKLILDAEIILQSSQQEYENGNLTAIERFQQMIDVWHRTSEVLKQNVVQHFRSTDILNPVYMMAFSGARGNISQVRQLVGMRGLMADPQGQILDFPIRSNFREGLTLTEYVISCYGARKGLVDTALRTANSGYLTRRLVDVAQHIIVRQLDCGTKNGILVTDMKDGKKTILSLQKRIIGRVLAEPIDSIALRNQDISPVLASKIVKLKNQVLVRSPLTCEAKNSICQLCYGWSLAHGTLVSLGEAVGVLAAQSIGEPGTQLTMRTFHTGGVFSGDVMQEIRSPIKGSIYFHSALEGNLIRTLHGKIAFLTKTEGNFYLISDTSLNSSKINYQIPKSTILFARHGEKIEKRQLLAEFSSFLTLNNQGIQAKFNLNSEKEGQIFFEDVLLVVKGGKEGDIIKTALKFGSVWILSGKLYQSPIRSNLFIKSGDLIDTNSIVNESILATPQTGVLVPVKKGKEKEIFLRTKIQVKKSILPVAEINSELDLLKQLLKGNQPREKVVNKYSIKKEKLSNDIILKRPCKNILIKEINYKKFGYFFYLDFLKDTTLFFSNSLYNNSLKNHQIFFELFDNETIKKSGRIYFQQNGVQDQKGQYFLYSQEFYQISKNNRLNSLKSNKNSEKILVQNFYLKKEKNILSTINAQGNKNKTILQRDKFLVLKASFFEQENTQNVTKDVSSLSKKINFLKENPYRKFSSHLNFYLSNNSNKRDENIRKKRNYYKKSFLPSVNLKKSTLIRKNKKQTNIQNLHNFFIDQDYLQFQKGIYSFDKKIISNLHIKLEIGWIIIPKKNSPHLYLSNSFYKPGNYKNFLKIDQAFVFTKILYLKQMLSFINKNGCFKKTCFIKNKLARINKISEKKIKRFFWSPEKQISRNKIYLRNFYFQTQFILLNKKIKEVNYKNKIRKTLLLQKFSNNLYLLKFYQKNSFLCNKQNITRLKPLSHSIDLQINFKWNKKEENYPRNSIVFVLPRNYSLKQIQLELIFPLNLEFSIIRQMITYNFLLPNNLSNEKILITKEKEIFEQTSLSFNSFFSPYKGEITSTKTDIIGKQKSLLLTNKDQISFNNNEKNSFIKIGQLLRYGDKLNLQTAIQESGQIIQINKNKITLRKAQPILFSSQGVFHVDNGDLVEKNTPLITLFYQKLKTEDIVQGIPKIEELFEARQTKEGESLQENLHTKLHFFFNFYKQQFSSQEAAKKSIEKIQQILVNNVQKVYQSQGVTISDKHIEIIVRQMTTKVKITESGRTGLLRGELIDLDWVNIINLGIEAQNELIKKPIKIEKAEYEPVILGITKAALETESFISASSFQETTRILSRAAIERKTDFLRGLKENVILGHLIPAGTGFTLSFNPKIKISNTQKKLSWLSYKDIINMSLN